MKDKYETVFQAHSLRFLIVALLLSFGFCDSYAFTDTFEVSVGETFTVQTTSKRGTYAIEWSYDSYYIQPVGTITATSPRVTFRAVRKYQGLDFKVITRYNENDSYKTHTDTYRVTITDDTKVSLPVTSLNLATGETQYLSASVDNNYYKGIYNWYSSNPDVVYASGYSDVGGITGKKPGNAIVTVELENGNKATCSVTVNNVDVNSASISPTSTTLKVGEKTTLSLTVIPSNATVTSKSWKSKNTSIATVDENGTVTAVSSGSTEIYCVVNGKITSNSCVVTVKEPVKPTGITVSPSSMNINIGDTKTLSYSLTPTDATTTVRWESDNTSIATVGKYSGEVKGVGVGTTYIWAITANGKKDCCIVTVEEPPFIGVKYAIAGYDHSLVIKEDGSLWACGNNENGQLCNGKTSEIHSFTKIMNGVSNAAAGNGNSRIIKDDGSLWACGTNTFGQLGDGTTTTRRYLKKVMDNVAYVTGTFQSLIIKKDATLWVCGNNLFGILGNGTTEGIISPVKIMNDVASVNSANLSHSLIVKKDGSLWACGYNNYGQLGDGTTTDRTTPVKIMENVSTVAAGGGHSLIVKKDGTLWACGRNDYGQLGDGTTTNRGSFKKIMDNVASVEATSRYSFIIKTDGSLWACGDNDYGQLGAGFASMYSTPVKIMDDVRSVSTLQVYTLIVKKDGSLWACGTNKYGQLGNGTTTSRYTPVEIMEGNIESGINDFRYEKEVFNNSSTTKIYSITGQRISYPKKGINIINGKKVLVK